MILDGETEITLGGAQDLSGPKVKIAVLRRSARRILPDFPDLVEEAVQEAVLTLYSLPNPSSIRKPNGYAAWTARNAAIDLLKKELRQRDLVLDPRNKGSQATRYELEVYVLFLEFLTAIRVNLGERQRAVALLMFKGWKPSEIAAELGVSTRLVFKDLKRIRTLIQNLDPDDPNGTGGGGSGQGRPPPYMNLIIGLVDPEAWAVAAPLHHERNLRPEEVNYVEQSHQESRPQRRRLMHAHRRQRGELLSGVPGRDHPGIPEGTADLGDRPGATLDELRRLLLQLPAFRVADLAPQWNEEDSPPENLGDVLQRLVQRRQS